MNIQKNQTQFVYAIGTFENALIKDHTKHAKAPSTSIKMKKIRDFYSSIESLPSDPATRKNDEGELLHYKSNFNKPKTYKSSIQPKQSQMCHILGDVVRSAGLG